MKSLVEIVEDYQFKKRHRIDEMATISRPTDNLPRNTKICVFGENDIQGTKTPHFHVLIDNGSIVFEIYIKHGYDLNIWRYKNKKYPNWDNLNDVKNAVQAFLRAKHSTFPHLTNLEYIVQSWNDNNPTNEISFDYIDE